MLDMASIIIFTDFMDNALLSLQFSIKASMPWHDAASFFFHCGGKCFNFSRKERISSLVMLLAGWSPRMSRSGVILFLWSATVLLCHLPSFMLVEYIFFYQFAYQNRLFWIRQFIYIGLCVWIWGLWREKCFFQAKISFVAGCQNLI